MGAFYVPCLESITDVIWSNQEGFDLIRRSRISDGKVDSDEVLKGCA